MPRTVRSRKYVFTINNPTGEDIVRVQELECRYVIYGREVGESGTVHLQGFVYFDKKISRKKLSEALPRAYLDVANGTIDENVEYCSKDGDFVERGDKPIGGVGKKCTLKERAEKNKKLMSGSLLSLVEQGEVAITQIPLLKRARMILAQETEKYTHTGVRGLWIYGPPRTGKSHYARTLSDDYYIKPQNKWFDGYQGEHLIILDDFDTPCLAHLLKIWADKYHCTGETKGGNVNLVHRQFVITSNYKIRDLIEDPIMATAIEERFELKTMMVKYRPE